jgi:hypothetical protein
VRARRVLHRHLLDVVREDDAGDRPLRPGDAHGAVDQVARGGRVRALRDVVVRDVLEQR